MKLPYEEFDLSGVKTYPLRSRASKVTLAQFATPYKKGSGVDGLLKTLPSLLASSDFKAVVQAILTAQRAGRAIIWGLGAHVLKTGLSPVSSQPRFVVMRGSSGDVPGTCVAVWVRVFVGVRVSVGVRVCCGVGVGPAAITLNEQVSELMYPPAAALKRTV